MKHLSYFVALAAFLMFASCQKEDTPTESSVKDPVFTATIANDETKTSLDLSTKKVSWALEDEITVTDAKSTSVKYKVSSIDDEGVATFTKKSDETGTLDSGPYTASYGEAPSTSQTYTATEGVQNVTKLPMDGESDSSDNTKLTFTVSCGLLKVTLTQTGISISSIAVSNGTNTYTLTCNDAVSIASGATFYIAVPAGTYTSFKFTESNGYVSWRSPLSIAVEANHIKPVSSNFGPEYKEDETLYGYGSKINGYWWAPVNCGYDATDYTYGKLYQWGRKHGQGYYGGLYSLYNDADYPEKSGGNQSIVTLYSPYALPTSHPDGADYNGKFYEGQTNWYGGTDADDLWGATKTSYDPCPTGWRVPTYDELDALTDNNSSLGSGGWDDDNEGYWFNGTESPTTGEGLFLPAAGCRNYSNGDANYRGSFGFYWSSSVDDFRARYLDFYSTYADMGSYDRANGLSVRCVQE